MKIWLFNEITHITENQIIEISKLLDKTKQNCAKIWIIDLINNYRIENKLFNKSGIYPSIFDNVHLVKEVL